MTVKKCPICRKDSTKDFQPFCSKRCSDVDLSKWFSGNYSTPVLEEDDMPDTDEFYQ